jgi:hypothetical protein
MKWLTHFTADELLITVGISRVLKKALPIWHLA